MGRIPRVSVGVPVFNGENYLSEAVESLLGQTFEDLEIIISDNASTDATEEICRSFTAQDPRVRYIRQAKNEGAAANYNATADASGAEFFAWNAHDDVRHESWLEESVKALDRDPGASVAIAPTVRFGDGIPDQLLPHHPDLTSPAIHRRARAAYISPHPAIVLFGLTRRYLLNRTGRHGDFKGADRVFAVEMALQGHIVELNDVRLYNRDHPTRYTRIADDGSSESRRSQTHWWKTGHDGPKYPRWRGLRRVTGAMLGAPAPVIDRGRCLLMLPRALADDGGYQAKLLLKDLLD